MSAVQPVQPVEAVSNIPPRKSRLRGRVTNAEPGSRTEGRDVAPETSDIDRRSLCEDILREGCVQSFVDFFYLTHRLDPNQDATTSASSAPREVSVSPHEMLYVRDNLMHAESARRLGDTGSVYSSYSALAQHYHAVGDPKTGVYFYEKCLEISRLTEDYRGEMAANHDLGLIHQSMGEQPAAATYHERHLDLAIKHGVDAEERTAAAELVKVYQAIAEAHESKDERDGAIQVRALSPSPSLPMHTQT